jgi:transposase InsO family protein
MDEERFKIHLFDGNNFSDWNFRLKLQLDEQDMLPHVEKRLASLLESCEPSLADTAAQKKTKEEERKRLIKLDKKCKSFIVQRIQDGLLEVVKDKETAYDLWKALEDRFESKTATTRMTLSRDLQSLTYKPRKETFQEFGLRFDKLIRSLRQAGEAMDEEGAVIRFLLAMPTEYESVISALQTLVSKDLTMEFVRVRIEEYETSKKRTTNQTPKIHAPVVGTAFMGHVPSNSDVPFSCNNCGLRGHRKIHCWRAGGGAYRSRGRGRVGRGAYRRGRGLGSWTCTRSSRQPFSTPTNPDGRGGNSTRGRERSSGRSSASYRGGAGGNKTGPFSGTKEEAVNASCVVAEDIESAAYCFMSPVSDDDHVMRSGKVAQCLPQVGKEEAQNLTVLNSDGNVWYLDSGASHHMIQPKVHVVNKRKLEYPVCINIAKRSLVMHAYEQGDVIAHSKVKGSIHKILLKECLIVRDLKFNLISVSKLEIKGYHILFSQGRCSIMGDNWEVLAEGWRQGRIYQLSIRTQEPIEVQPVCKVAVTVRNNSLWHRRLGHINQQSLLKLSNVVSGIDKGDLKIETELCETCIEGRQHKAPFPGTRNPTTRPLERVHSDLCGPINPVAYNGVKYILTFIDDWTHFTVVFGLKSKSEVFNYIKLYEARVTSRFNSKISIFRCDNGTEFVNNDVRSFFEEKGVQYELTIPGTPENNGVAERMNRTILDKSRCMLLDSTLSKTFWIEAVMTAVYLINRSPTRSNKDDKVPAEKWFRRKPNLSNLRVFGSIAYLHVPKEQLHGKFESRSLKCIMLGYCNNGYRLWLVGKGRVISGRNVIFDENSKEHKKESFQECNEHESFQECDEHESFPQYENEEFPRI